MRSSNLIFIEPHFYSIDRYHILWIQLKQYLNKSGKFCIWITYSLFHLCLNSFQYSVSLKRSRQLFWMKN